jgi:hypothetical protein
MIEVIFLLPWFVYFLISFLIDYKIIKNIYLNYFLTRLSNLKFMIILFFYKFDIQYFYCYYNFFYFIILSHFSNQTCIFNIWFFKWSLLYFDLLFILIISYFYHDFLIIFYFFKKKNSVFVFNEWYFFVSSYSTRTCQLSLICLVFLYVFFMM